MKNRIRCGISFLLSVILIISTLPIPVLATSDTDFQYTVLSEADKTCEITACLTPAVHLTIPSEIDGYKVVSIGSYGFSTYNDAESITLPNSMISIGDNAFRFCDRLAKISIPDSVESIGRFAFDDTEYYKTESNWTDNVLYINNHLIKAKFNISSHSIKQGTKTIADSAFSECTRLINVELPDSVKYIGKQAFQYCRQLRNFSAQSDIENIGWDAFCGCSNLETVSVLGNVVNIGDFAFSYCEQLNSVSVLGKITSMGENVFSGCQKLKSFTCAGGFTTIGNGAFSGCRSLANIDLPNTLTSIGDGAFNSCSSLENIEFPQSLTSIGDYAFTNCDKLISISIPSGVKQIGWQTFSECENLAVITLPAGLESIGEGAFLRSPKINHVFFTGSQEEREQISIDVDNYCLTRAVWHYNASANKCIIIDENVPPTCTEKGKIVYHCSLCNKSYDTAFAPIAAEAGHQKDEMISITAPTCIEQGYTTYHCDVCDTEFMSDYTEATGHTPKMVSVIAPTCKEQGYSIYHCTVCGIEYKDNYTSPVHQLQNGVCVLCGYCASEHPYSNNVDNTWTIQRPDAPFITVTFSKDTATEANYDWIYIYDADDNVVGKYSGTELAGKKITIPGDTVKVRLVADDDVTAYGFEIVDVSTEDCIHKDIESVLCNPTCMKDGILQHTCSICGRVEQTAIPARGYHSLDGPWIMLIEPTCTKDGEYAKICPDCGQVLYRDPAFATGHTPGDWVTTKEPTYTEPGEEVCICTVCGEIVARRKIEKLHGILGDVNQDGEFTTVDARWILQAASGIRALSAKQIRLADLNGDGKLTTVDARWALQIASGIRPRSSLSNKVKPYYLPIAAFGIA